MRNKFGGGCYKCGLWVRPGTGHFERYKGRWRAQHGLHIGEGRVTCTEAARQNIAASDPRPPNMDPSPEPFD